MEFGIPPSVGDNYPKHVDPLKAEGNLDYLQFIDLVTELWDEAHPDIPIKPVQSKTFTKYPVIVYGLQLRKPMNVEPKQRYREQIHRPGEDTNLIINAQRFENVISFEVRTQGDPKGAEVIMEVFEDFMQEYTPVFKRLGVSDMFYMRRTPDGEETRRDDDVEVRTVAYMVILEKVRVTEVRTLKELTVRARTVLKNEGAEFKVLNDDDDFLTIVHHNFKVYDFIELKAPSYTQLDASLPFALPPGVDAGIPYQIWKIDGDKVYLWRIDSTLEDPNYIPPHDGATPVSGLGKGMGRYKQVTLPYGNLEIEDNDQATPDQ